MSKFTTVNAAALEATGRVGTGGRKPPLVLTIEHDLMLCCTNTDGFNIAINIRSVGQRVEAGSDWGRVDDIECTLSNGAVILCEGSINHASGRLRLDATDQDNYSWFWFEVRPNFRRMFQ